MTDRRQPKKAVWKKVPPRKEGWYWYRDAERETVLHVFDPLGNGYWKAWDWDRGRLQLCLITPYTGEWYGPIGPPK